MSFKISNKYKEYYLKSRLRETQSERKNVTAVKASSSEHKIECLSIQHR